MSDKMVKKSSFLSFNEEETGYHFGKKEFIDVLIALVLFIILYVITLPGLSKEGQTTLAILIMTLVLWMNPGIPQTMTTVLMIVLAISFKIMTLPEVFSGFGSSPFLMVFSLLVVAMGMTNTQLARRLAYFFIIKLGTSPSMLLLALISTTTVVTSMVADIPALIVCMSITSEILKEMGEKPGRSRFGKAMMFGISFASITGGLAFISGSGINPVGISVLEQVTKGEMTINFTQWAAIGVPFAIIMNFVIWLILRTMYKISKSDAVAHQLDVEIFKRNKMILVH
jgi:sodium-dependent dicarboxylate transporter 2/3/5